MTNETLLAIKQRTEKAASWRSDDFGHNTQRLLEAESQALQIAADDIAALLAEVERQSKVIEYLNREYGEACKPHEERDLRIAALEAENARLTERLDELEALDGK